MLTIEQVAEKLSVSKMSIYRLIKTGELQAFKFRKQIIRIEEKDLDEFLEERRIKN